MLQESVAFKINTMRRQWTCCMHMLPMLLLTSPQKTPILSKWLIFNAKLTFVVKEGTSSQKIRMKDIRKGTSCPDEPAETSQKFAKSHLKKLYLYIPQAQANCDSFVCANSTCQSSLVQWRGSSSKLGINAYIQSASYFLNQEVAMTGSKIIASSLKNC